MPLCWECHHCSISSLKINWNLTRLKFTILQYLPRGRGKGGVQEQMTEGKDIALTNQSFQDPLHNSTKNLSRRLQPPSLSHPPISNRMFITFWQNICWISCKCDILLKIPCKRAQPWSTESSLTLQWRAYLYQSPQQSNQELSLERACPLKFV